MKIFGENVVHAESKEIDGIVYDRFDSATCGIIRTTDKDSGEVIAIVKYPSLDSVRAEYANAVEMASRCS